MKCIASFDTLGLRCSSRRPFQGPVCLHKSKEYLCAELLDHLQDQRPRAQQRYILLNIGWSIRIYILMTGRNVEQTKDVRMYIEEFILVEIWIHCCTKLKRVKSIGKILVYIHLQQRNEICENCS